MRYLDTHALERMLAGRPRAARRRRCVWLVWVRPHFPTGKFHQAWRTDVRWPLYLQQGDAA